MEKSLFRFASQRKHNLDIVGKKQSYFKRFFSNKIAVFLLIIWLLMIFISFINIFLNSSPYEEFANLNLDKNITAHITVSKDNPLLYTIEKRESDNIYQTIYSIVSKEDNHIYHTFITNNLQREYLVFNLDQFFSSQAKHDYRYALLGTDRNGYDVLVHSLKLFFYSFGCAMLCFVVEMFFGFSCGIFLARKQSQLRSFIKKSLGSIVAVPDIMYILISLVIWNSITGVIVAIIVTGSVRLTYWAASYAEEEWNKEYVKALIAMNASVLRIVYVHILWAIFGRILILFARRLGYIIFLLATISFLGFTINWNIASLFKENWTDRAKNMWQIVFPTLYLFIFLITNQFLAIQIARVVDNN
ncbi:hypothetical protein ACWXVL_00935 [Mycoplasma sp. 128]